jgi:hypothetical protein
MTKSAKPDKKNPTFNDLDPGDRQRSFFSMFQQLVDRGILRDLKPAELRLFFALCKFADFDTGKCHPGREQLMELTGLSEHAFAEAIRGLKQRALIKAWRGSERVHFHYQYEVLCFGAGNLHQSKNDDPAMVQVTYIKAKAPDEEKGDAAMVQVTSACYGAGNLHQKPLEPHKSGNEKNRSSVSHEGKGPPRGEQPIPPINEIKSEITDERLREIEAQGFQIPLSLKKKPSKGKEKS